jgi:hypothetical protein
MQPQEGQVVDLLPNIPLFRFTPIPSFPKKPFIPA